MGKSNYPNAIDSSSNIPSARNNVTEVYPEIINSLRSAIFQIERTLGIMPNGIVGSNLADRLSSAIDANGNIKKSAITAIDLLSGPILNKDVSASAGIVESKLKLTFPTALLQTEISSNNTQISVLVAQLNSMISLLAAHTARAASRHAAADISIASALEQASAVGTRSVPSGDVQSAIEEIYSGHLNFDGNAISSINFSHNAGQIYYRSSSGVLTAISVSGALDELYSGQANVAKTHRSIMHSNGLSATSNISPPTGTLGYPIIENFAITYSPIANSTSKHSTLTLQTPINNVNIAISDTLIISDPTDTQLLVSGSYQVSSVLLDLSGNITAIIIYGVIPSSLSSVATASVYGKTKRKTDNSELLITAIPDPGATTSRSIQILNPDSAKIRSIGLSVADVTPVNRFINISVNGSTPLIVDTYDASLATQTIHSIVSAMNSAFIAGHLQIMAYADKSEIILALSIPDTITTSNTFTITTGSDAGIIALGFNGFGGAQINSKFGSSYYINGNVLSGLKLKLNETISMTFSASSLVITTTTLDFIKMGILKGDYIYISGSPLDNGAYLIDLVSATTLTISSAQTPSGFNAVSDVTAGFEIYDNIINFSSELSQITNNGINSFLFDVFIDENQNLLYSKVFEYEPILAGVLPAFHITGYSGEIKDGSTPILVFSIADLRLVGSFDGGPNVIIDKVNAEYIFYSQSGLSISILVKDTLSITQNLTPIVIHAFSSISSSLSLKVSSVSYSRSSGKVLSDISRYDMIGNIGPEQISKSFISNELSLPMSELRSNGVLHGLEVTSVSVAGSTYNVTYSGGVAFIAGKRITVQPGVLATGVDSATNSKMFIKVKSDGTVISDVASFNCASPFGGNDECPIAISENNGTIIDVIDVRLFIGEIDLKIISEIVVSRQPGIGHFSNLRSAIRYAKRFSELYNLSGTPTIRLAPGGHTLLVDVNLPTLSSADIALGFSSKVLSTMNLVFNEIISNGIFIDFPLKIVGDRNSSIVLSNTKYTLSDGVFYDLGYVVIAGAGFSPTTTLNYDTLSSGNIEISDVKFVNTKIMPIDFMTEDATGVPINAEVHLSNLEFDFSLFANPGLFPFIDESGVYFSEVYNQTEPKGNLFIDNCKFISSMISILRAGTVVRNISITNCNQSKTQLFQLVDRDIVGINATPSENQISFRNNVNLDDKNISTSNRPMAQNQFEGGWGDRISRDLIVGGDVRLKQVFTHTSFRTTKILHWEVGQNLNVGPGSNFAPTVIAALGLNTGNADLGRNIFNSVLFPYSISIDSYVSIPIPNIKISVVDIGIDYNLSGSTWSAEVVQYDSFNNFTSLSNNNNTTVSASNLLIVALNNPRIVRINIANYNLTPGKMLYLKIIRKVDTQTTTIVDINHYYTKLHIDSANIIDHIGGK